MPKASKPKAPLVALDDSSDEDESVAVAVGEPVVFAQPAPDAVVEEASTSDGRVRCARRKGNW